jgi:hypothetical protein
MSAFPRITSASAQRADSSLKAWFRRLLAEAVEKVGLIEFSATIVRLRRTCGNIDSMECRVLNHCFKNFDPRDFFNSLG